MNWEQFPSTQVCWLTDLVVCVTAQSAPRRTRYVRAHKGMVMQNGREYGLRAAYAYHTRPSDPKEVCVLKVARITRILCRAALQPRNYERFPVRQSSRSGIA